MNSLWSTSLVLNLICAILANLLQQWARRYLEATQTDSVLHKRAHTRAFYAEGVKNFFVPWVFETLPAMLHLSVFCFFAGLVMFLWKFDPTISELVLSLVSLFTVLYGCATVVPIFHQDSPYSTPFTPLARYIFVVVLMVFVVIYIGFRFLVLFCFRHRRLYGSLTFYLKRVLDITFATSEEAALHSSPEIDCRAFLWTLSRLDEDHGLERFFSGLPGFYNSKALKEPLRYLTDQQKHKLVTRMVGFLDRTLSSNLFPNYVKSRRVDICANATDVMTPKVFVLHKLASEDSDGYGPMRSTETVQFFRHWVNRRGEDTAVVNAIFSIVLARVQEHDDSWFMHASDDMGAPEYILRSHATYGDSLQFAILIHIIRQQFIHLQNPSWPSNVISNVLEAASKFNASDTSQELQNEFCALWNEMVLKAQNDHEWKIASDILKRIQRVYNTLHPGTDDSDLIWSLYVRATTDDQNVILSVDPSTYPLCNIAGHSSADSHNNAVPSPALPALAFPAPAPAFQTGPDVFSSEVFPSPHFDDVLVAVPPTSANAGAIQDINASSITTPYPTPQTSTSGVPPHPSTSPLAAGFLQYNSDPLKPSDLPSFPSTVSNPVLDTTGPSLSTYLPMTRS